MPGPTDRSIHFSSYFYIKNKPSYASYASPPFCEVYMRRFCFLLQDSDSLPLVLHAVDVLLVGT
jgi:hypothetical protein